MPKFTFRPHHFLCALCFVGKGYSPKFIRNLEKIINQLKQDANNTITVTTANDSICEPCPHRQNHLCHHQETINQLDNRAAQILQLETGDQFSWEQLKAHVAHHLTIEKFHYTCEGCGWKKTGICEAILTRYCSSS